MTPAASRYGPYAAERPLARAPGAMFLEGRADDGSQVLLQVVHLSPATDAAAEERRQSYVHMAARATEDLQRDEEPKVLEHASVSQDDGSLSLWWALPWVDGAEQLGVIQPPTPDELLQWSAVLLMRLQDRHDRGRVDPLLSPSVLVVRPKTSPQVVGLPIHLPLEWPAPELAPPPRAPEEITRNEPGPLGDIWRVGRCLSALAAGVPTPPDRWESFLSRLVEARPAHRYQSAQAALQELQRLGHSAPTLPMGANLNNLSSDLLLPNDPNDNLSEPLLAAPPETNDGDIESAHARSEHVPESGDTRLDFPSPLKADSPKIEALPAKKTPQTYAGGGELETIRAPFPKNEPAQKPVVQDQTPRAPSTINDGETLLDVIKPKEIRQYGIPDEPPTDPPPGPRPMMAEDPASQMTLRDVSREKLEAMDSGEEPTDERENKEKKRKSWDGPAAKPISAEADKPAEQPNKLLATGPRGTVVGVRMIDDPTGMREMPQDALPKLLPPPEPSLQPEVPRPAASPSGDIPLPAARIVNHITDVPKPGGPAPGAPLPQAPAGPPPTQAPPQALVHAPQPPAWAQPPGQTPGSVPPPRVPPMKTLPHGGPAANPGAWPGKPNQSLVPAGQAAPPAAWGPPAAKPAPKRSGASALFVGVTAFFVAGAGAALLASGILTDSSELVDGQAPVKMVTITAANEVLVQATPSNAVVISERTGRILGSTPLRFLVPSEGSVAIMIAAKGHEPQRVLLPARGRIRTDLVPLPDESQTCELKINAPPGVMLEGVAGATDVDGRFLLVGAALVRGTRAEGAWLVRCPQLGGQINPTLEARPKSGPVMLRVIGPTDADVSLNGEPLGRVPVRQRVQPGFHEVAVEKISRGRVERLVPVFSPTKLRMPRPELKKPVQ